MINLNSVNFRREIRLWASHFAPRTWERREETVKIDGVQVTRRAALLDTDWHNWDMQATDDLRFIIVTRLKAGVGHPMDGKSYHIPIDAESVDSFIVAPPQAPVAQAVAPKNLKK